MAEVEEESTHVWSSKQRIALFLTAMRHFALEVEALGWALHYTRLDAGSGFASLATVLQNTIENIAPCALILCAPGDFRVWKSVKSTAAHAGIPLDVRDDRHFYATVRQFAAHAAKRKSLRLEYFYRELRQQHGVLMDGGQPTCPPR